MRRHAAEALGEAATATPETIYALMAAQHDGDEAVARAALAALDRIHPPADLALRVHGGDCYEEVADDVIVRPAYVAWRRVACVVDPLPDGETLGPS